MSDDQPADKNKADAPPPKKAAVPKPGRPVTKADMAAQKRMDKMVIKRMRKR